MKRLVLVEEDDGLAACLTEYFQDRYWVSRRGDLPEAIRLLRAEGGDVLFADLSRQSMAALRSLQELRAVLPRTHIVLTYLAPIEDETREGGFKEVSDLFLRKPYDVKAVDEAIRRISESPVTRPPGQREQEGN